MGAWETIAMFSIGKMKLGDQRNNGGIYLKYSISSCI